MERNKLTLTEKFLKYRNATNKKDRSIGLTLRKSKVTIPEISYPCRHDIEDELSVLKSYKK